ncbi:alpha/beta fold hydrolase [Shewanella sp. JM162201]|uniref:Alpha/beta fold hydrolase n=1 Tax=Shewanella jiangmenensis TaxID=2837387 RepID=A0ABS5V4S5_9GAMM|nr:alpha/beta fold hydrolase [Shewanella jiangmenensis]MBT1444806.1 alpha/beta fold hydrolase [Shewanella jiangmenensis]
MNNELELDTLLPFKRQYFRHQGNNIHYVDEGPAAPKGTVVMVHGNPSWTIYYRNLITALKGEYRCIAMDNVGCGLSDKPDDSGYDYTLSSRIADLEALLAHLNVTKNVTLVVHDWGGMIGMGWASRHVEAIERLVILNTAAFHLPASKPLPLRLKICRNTALGTLLVRGFNAFAGLASVIGCKRNPMSAPLRKAYVAPFNNWANRISTLRFVQDIPLQKGDKAFDEVSRIEASLGAFTKVPTLICWGLKDFVFDKHFLDVWQQKLPDAQVHAFADCGHYILEDASDEVIGHIRAFVAQEPAQAVLAS